MLPHGTPYLHRPHLDPSLAQFRIMNGGGWATKVPNGEGKGFVLVHIDEADRDTYKWALGTLGLDLSGLPADPAHPVDISRGGLLLRAVFDNRSKRGFRMDWSDGGREAGLMVSMCHDLESPWYPRFGPDAAEILTGEADVAPGKVQEALILLEPEERGRGEDDGGADGRDRVHFFHMATAFLTVPYSFEMDIGGAMPEVPFPFFQPHREIPNAILDLRFSADYDPKQRGRYILPPMQVVSIEGARWMTEGYVRLEAPVAQSSLSFFVPAIRTRPGPSEKVPVGRELGFDTCEPWYKLPSNLVVSAPKGPIGGGWPRRVDGWRGAGRKS